jgi:hypothetical protein
MGQPSGVKSDAEVDVPLFDVVVRLPSSTSLEQLQAQATAAGIAPERVAALVNALRNVPYAKIGSGVPRERADNAKQQFGKAGLVVEVTPVLSIASMTKGVSDGLTGCPACKKRVALTADRQCPACGVFVDKITDEALLRKKIAEQERFKADFLAERQAREAERQTKDALETAMRNEIRKEMERKYRKKGGGLLTVGGGLRVLLVVALAAGAFVGGRGSSAGWSWSAFQPGGDKAKVASGDPDKMLDSLGPKAPGAAAGAPLTGDPDLDDPLIREAGGERIGAKGLTVEQAVAAAQVLAKSVGNDTADRALSPTSGGSAGPAAAGAAPGTAAVAGVPGAAAAGTPSAAVAAAAAAAAPADVPAQMKTMFALALTRQMAEMGQWPRAQAIIAKLRSSSRTIVDPEISAAAQAVDVEVRAWALPAAQPGAARAAADRLLAEADTLPPTQRAQALGQAGVVLSGQPQIAPDVSRAMMDRATKAVQAITSVPARTTAIADLSVAIGQVLLGEATAQVKAGAWNKAKAAGAQLEALVAQVPAASAQARLLAIDYQLKTRLGLPDAAAASLARSLAAAEQVADLPERAAVLHAVAQLSGAGSAARMETAVQALQAQAMGRPGMERARTLVELAVLQSGAGQRTKAAELAAAARATPVRCRPNRSWSTRT